MMFWFGFGNCCRSLLKAGSKRLDGILLPGNAVREIGAAGVPTVERGSYIVPLTKEIGLPLASWPVAAAPRMLEKSPVFIAGVGTVALLLLKPRPCMPPEEAMRVPW